MAALLAPLLSRVLPLVLAGLAAFVLGCTLTHKLDAAASEAQTIKYQQAVAAANAAAAATQNKITQAALVASDKRSAQLTQENATLQTELSDVSKHLDAKAMPCIPYGFIRLHDAAVLRVAPASLALPAGKSDGSCAPFTAAQLATAIIGNYNRALHNADQLNALIAYDKSVQAAMGKSK